METKWSAQILLSSNRLKKVEFFCESNLRQDAEQRCKALYGVTDVRQLTRSMPNRTAGWLCWSNN